VVGLFPPLMTPLVRSVIGAPVRAPTKHLALSAEFNRNSCE